MDRQSQIYRSSKSRLTARQLEYNKINDLIVEFIKTLTEPENAELLWLEFSNVRYKMSMSSFYGRLKKLVEAGLIVKTHLINNKFVYTSPLNNI